MGPNDATPRVGFAVPASGRAGDAARPVLLEAVVASAMDAIVAVDAEQRVVLFNPAAEAMFGCASADALGAPLDRFLPTRYHAVHRRHVAAFMATGDTSRTMGHLRPLAARRADGHEFPIEATISQVTIAGQSFGAAIVRDISARHASEAEVRRQANLIDLAYDAILTWDWSGPITSWNQGAERLYGYRRAEAVGRVSHDLLHTRHPEGLTQYRATLAAAGTWEGELVHTTRGGDEVIVESRSVLVNHGNNAYILEVNRDTTARKRAEADRAAVLAQEAAAQAEAAAAATERDRMRDILNGLPGGVQILTPLDGTIDFANAAFLELVFGEGASFDAKPIYGRDFTFLRADGLPLPVSERPGMRALRGEQVRSQQLLLERASGKRLPVSAHAAPLHGSSGTVEGAIVVIQDVTELRQAEQLKDDFLALISHEFRTPLTAIHGGAHLLANDAGTLNVDGRRELLSDVVAESERLDRMLGNILTLANVLGGRLRVATEPVLVAPLARKVASDMAGRSEAHAFTVEIAGGLPPIEADPDLLEQVLRNLYENAVKYAPGGGSVRTTADHDGAMVTIRVTDEGIGIAPEHVSTVFERFRRVGGDPTVRGMGLGLYLSRHLVEAQEGQISVSSPGLGQGTTFAVTLPLAVGWDDAEEDERAPGGKRT